ncbi:hypothetical protein [Nakamurella aerolata]|uniref:hypothetical protein n=1 Tax=Nakamurella aerolata TaxID=1656892 RepID=UPI001FEBC8AA|nr:hypothetical protein [Nakamurella aerolata]
MSAGSAVRDVLRGFPETAKATAWGLATAWRQTRSAVVLSVASAVVLAVAPAVQVQAVAWLVRSSESLRDAAFPLLTLVVFIGAGQVLAAIDLFTRQRASLRLERSLQATLVGRVSGMSPAELADPAVSADVQISRDSLRELGMLPWSAISAMSAVLAFGGLFVSVWSISPLAAGLIIAAIIPSLVIFAWPRRGRQRSSARSARSTGGSPIWSSNWSASAPGWRSRRSAPAAAWCGRSPSGNSAPTRCWIGCWSASFAARPGADWPGPRCWPER